MKDDNALPMPLDYLKPGPRKLSEVPLGESVCINFTDVSVDLNRKTYADRDARVYEGRTFSTVIVRMEKEGCVLTLPSRKRNPPIQYTPRRRISVVDYVPVIAFLEDEDQAD